MTRLAAFTVRAASLLAALILSLAAPPAMAQPAAPALRIVVLEGEDSVNLIDKKTAVKPTVEVRDRNDLPVAGAAVTFAIRGKAAAFGNGVRQLTVTSDTLGRATVDSLTPISKGSLQIQVQASYQGQTATATIHQANFASATQAAQAGKMPAQAGQSGASGSTGSTGASGGAAGGGGSAAAGGAAAAGGGAAAAGGGLSTLAITGIAIGGAAAATTGIVVANRNSDPTSTGGQSPSGTSPPGSAGPTGPAGPNPGNPTVPTVNLSGTWNVAVTGSVVNGALTLRLTQNGNSLSGTDITPLPAVEGLVISFRSEVTGTVSSSDVRLKEDISETLSITVPGEPGPITVSCTGTVAYTLTIANSSSMSGTWTYTANCANAGVPPFTDGGRVTFTKQ